jgi:Spy/CpxP family protein refolding chaperone
MRAHDELQRIRRVGDLELNKPYQGKTMDRNIAAILIALAMIVARSAYAEGNAADVTDMQALRTAVKADKRAFVASTLQLTDVEAKKFWPIYDDYQRDIDMANRQQTRAIEGLIARDKPVSSLYAKALANDLIASDEAEIKARRKMFNRLIKALPPSKAARYMQLEAKIRAYQDYDVATTFPLIR